jgi:hypothetical protein
MALGFQGGGVIGNDVGRVIQARCVFKYLLRPIFRYYDFWHEINRLQ